MDHKPSLRLEFASPHLSHRIIESHGIWKTKFQDHPHQHPCQNRITQGRASPQSRSGGSRNAHLGKPGHGQAFAGLCRPSTTSCFQKPCWRAVWFVGFLLPAPSKAILSSPLLFRPLQGCFVLTFLIDNVAKLFLINRSSLILSA